MSLSKTLAALSSITSSGVRRSLAVLAALKLMRFRFNRLRRASQIESLAFGVESDMSKPGAGAGGSKGGGGAGAGAALSSITSSGVRRSLAVLAALKLMRFRFNRLRRASQIESSAFGVESDMSKLCLYLSVCPNPFYTCKASPKSVPGHIPYLL